MDDRTKPTGNDRRRGALRNVPKLDDDDGVALVAVVVVLPPLLRLIVFDPFFFLILLFGMTMVLPVERVNHTHTP